MLLKKRSSPKADTGDLKNDTVIATRRDDFRAAYLRPEHCNCSQACDGPRYLVIDPEATDLELVAMAKKLELPLSRMQEFRNEL